MALFQKKPIVESVMPLYTLSANKNLLIVGLGNPEDEYAGTRHNIGFEAIDAFAENNEFDPWAHKKDLKSYLAQKTLGDTRVILAKPQTYMNNSGEAVQAISSFYKIAPEHVIIMHDELDVPFGQIRCRVGGGTAGHNGVKSVLQHIDGELTGRIRIGVGPKTHEQMDSADFVLQRFSEAEQGRIKDMTREVSAILTETIYGEGRVPHETRTF